MLRPDELMERLDAVCSEVGVDFDDIGPVVRARMQLLAAHTHTVDDCTRIAELARLVFEYYERHKPEARFSPIEKRIVVIGSLFSDIGKSGPLHADADGQRLVAEIFSVEGVRDDQQSVAALMSDQFPADAPIRLQRFRQLGLDPSMTMRAFWNHHADWTFDIVRNDGLPAEAVAAAATHHMLDNINPGAIVGADGSFSVGFGDNLRFDRAEKLVILLDKYDAVLRRGRGHHAEAIKWLRALLGNHPRFAGDAEFTMLLDDLDASLGARPITAIDAPLPTKE